jgi:rod shape-determining protein MreD
MHWIGFGIVLYCVTALQASLVPFIAIHTVRPDLMVIIAVHYCLAARSSDAMLAAWFVGLAIDLTSLSYTGASNVGVHALSLGLIGFVIVKMRELTFRESIWTQLFFCFAAKTAMEVLAACHMRFVLDAHPSWFQIVSGAASAGLYTALLAPYGHWMLRRLRGLLGLGTTHTLRIR